MRAVWCREFGSEDNLRVEEVPSPELQPGCVRIRVRAAGVNFPDILCVRGLYQFKPPLPFAPGGEGAGEIMEVAADVTDLRPGDRVLFTVLAGAFAEEIVVPAAKVVRIPDSMPFEVAAGFAIVYGTSYYALKQRAALKAGETLLVLGAAGGVGLAAVELGRAMGATVIAAASSPEKLAMAKEHGADAGIDYAQEDLKARVKALTDGHGADGRHLVIGFAGGRIPKLPLNLPLLKGASVVGVFWGAWAERKPEEHAQNMRELFALYEAGRIRPHVDAQFPLEAFDKAFAAIRERRVKGKIVLVP